jgi:hypothetical protein
MYLSINEFKARDFCGSNPVYLGVIIPIGRGGLCKTSMRH